MSIVLDGTSGIATPEITSAGGPLVVNVSAPDNSVVVDASGNVGIGTSAAGFADVTVLRQATTSTNATLSLVSGTSGNSRLFFGDAQNTNDEFDGFIQYDQGNRLMQFGTAQAERMRIDSSGNLLVGVTSTGGDAHVLSVSSGNVYATTVRNASATPNGLYIPYTAASPNSTGAPFLQCVDSTTARATIRSNGGIANFSGNDANLSDRREKTNFAPAKSYLETICAIPVQTFNYIDQNMEEDPGLTLGVVAQDVQAVAPELVMESNWGTKEEPKMRLSIYQTDLQYALMKAIQELKAINDAQAQTIESLTARVVALEQA